MITVESFKVKRDVFFLFKSFVKKNKETFHKVELCLVDGEHLEPGTVVKTNLGTKLLVMAAKNGVNYLRTIRKEVSILPPSTIQKLPWKYIPQN